MGNNSFEKTGRPLAHHDHDHEPHKHPDLATREAHLEKLIAALKQTGMQSGDSYYAGYSSINPNSQMAQQRGNNPGFSLA